MLAFPEEVRAWKLRWRGSWSRHLSAIVFLSNQVSLLDQIHLIMQERLQILFFSATCDYSQ